MSAIMERRTEQVEAVEADGLKARLARLAGPLFGCAMSRVADRELALEATQEALTRGSGRWRPPRARRRRGCAGPPCRRCRRRGRSC